MNAQLVNPAALLDLLHPDRRTPASSGAAARSAKALLREVSRPSSAAVLPAGPLWLRTEARDGGRSRAP